jgi:MFS transporter, FHS family, Na+ dependent glucose transporter 1
MKNNREVSIADPKEFQKFLTYAICFVSLGVGVASIGPILPFLANNVGVSLGQISFVFTAQNLGYLIGSVGGGRLFDRVKSHHLMILSLGLMVVMGLLIPLVSWFYLLLVVLFFFGLGLGTMDVGGNLNLVWIFESRVSPYMNALHFSFGVGGFLAPIIISLMLGWTEGNLTYALWTLFILFLPGFIGLTLLKSPENVAKKADHGENLIVNFRMVGLMVLIFFLSVGVQSGFGGWIFTYVSELQIADVAAAALMTSIYWGALTLGRLVAIPVSKKVAPAWMLLFNCGMAVFVLGLILVWPLSRWMMWVGSAGLGLALSSIFPTLLSFAEARMNMTGRVTGLFFLGASLGGMLLPMLLGQIFEYVGSYEIMLTLFGASFLGLLVVILLQVNQFQEKSRDQPL